tara:strand:- start:221 stop:1702 length:1482 start_codon:yes stop_codon:yes gene_type:complete
MPLLPLDIPAGIYRNGTDLQSQGRWRDSNLVRWHDGTMQPVQGWRVRADTATLDIPRSLKIWRDNSSNRWIAAGTYRNLYMYDDDSVRFDITPTGLTAGSENAVDSTSYGGGGYGEDPYGEPRPETTLGVFATTWSLDTWGEYLLACSSADGKIYEWQLNTSTLAAAVTNAPTGNTAMVVTDERFVFALGAGGNPRKIQWSDRENNTVWTAAATNEAGSIELQTSGVIQCGVRVQNQTLILTTTDAHTATYSGPPYVYGVERVGTSCGSVSQQGVAVVDMGAVWMGRESFFVYSGGTVQELNSDVADYIYSDINVAQMSKIVAVPNAKFSEIRWFYPSAESIENDSYVAFNYQENTWSIGKLARTAAADAGVYRFPIYASPTDKKLYEHEVGFNYDSLAPYAETGPIMLGVGDNVMSVTQMIPDERNQGNVQATLKTRFYPNDTERSYGPYTMTNPVSLRLTGRQIRLRIDTVVEGDWRVGINRLEVKTGGNR